MKLLLDELYSSEIASRLRDKGHDVVAVAEEDNLIGLSDRDLIEVAVRDGRVVMTNNVADFIPLATAMEHYGLLFTSDHSLPRSRDTIGLFVRTLDTFMNQRKKEDALRGQWMWLGP